MLCAPVFIFTSGSSALLGWPRLPYSYTFLSLCQFVSRENGQNTKNTRSPPFSHDMKMAPDGLLGAQSINTESASLRCYLHLNSLLPCLSDDTTTVQSSTRTQSCSQKTCLLSSTCQSGPASGSEVLELWCQQSYNIFRCLCSELGADKMQTWYKYGHQYVRQTPSWERACQNWSWLCFGAQVGQTHAKWQAFEKPKTRDEWMVVRFM